MSHINSLKRAYVVGFGLLAALIFALFAFIPSAHAGTFSSAAPKPPAGWHVTYSHNFVTQGIGDWVEQPGGGAQVVMGTKPGDEFGVGIKLTAKNQWAELISKSASMGPNSFVQELVFVPPVPGTDETANWPAWWASNNPWPASGEDDMLEGENGISGFHSHYGATAATEQGSPNHYAPGNNPGTDWVTISVLRENGVAKGWYNGTYLGEVPLPVSKGGSQDETLRFQNQSYATAAQGNVCPSCFGPYAPATAWLSRVTIYSS
jgi:hypothetical protein